MTLEQVMREASKDVVSEIRTAFRREPRLGPHFELTRVSRERDGTILLEGAVKGVAQKKLALLLAAAAAPENAGLVDRIRVLPKMIRGDAELRTRIREVLAQDTDFADLDFREDILGGVRTVFAPVSGAGGEARGRIDIEVEDGVVTLNGYVPTLVRKRLAGALAWRVDGVRDVINGLVVRPAEEDGPDQLEEAVRVVLERDGAFDAGQVKVGVRAGVVRLTGLLRTTAQREAAENDAWSVFGVDDVIDEIEVRA